MELSEKRPQLWQVLEERDRLSRSLLTAARLQGATRDER